MCSNPCESELTCFWPESNRGSYGLPNFISATLSTTELWWRMNHQKSFRTPSVWYTSRYFSEINRGRDRTRRNPLQTRASSCRRQSRNGRWFQSYGILECVVWRCHAMHCIDHQWSEEWNVPDCASKWYIFLLKFSNSLCVWLYMSHRNAMFCLGLVWVCVWTGGF